jgi:hypothetical protein
LNFKANLTGKIYKDDLFFYISIADRFVFGSEGYNYGLPIFGIGVIANVLSKSLLKSSLNDFPFLKPNEEELIQEINTLRSHPSRYKRKIKNYINEYQNNPELIDIENEAISLKFKLDTNSNFRKIVKVDTVELVLEQKYDTLLKDLCSINQKSILKPDKGLYYATSKFAKNQDLIDTTHFWKTDSLIQIPKDIMSRHAYGFRINTKFIYRYPQSTARDIISQLLIDESMENDINRNYVLLNPDWTHIAVYYAGIKNGLYRYILVLGQKEISNQRAKVSKNK